jgi:hypothetical protein
MMQSHFRQGWAWCSRILVFFALLTLGFLGSSCRKGELLGREVQVGDNDIFLFSTDQFHLSAKTVPAQRIRTDERFSGMLGAYVDPIFGPSLISYYSQFHLQEEGFSFPADAVFDSAFVSFRLSGGYREKNIPAETRSLMHFKVYELAQDIYLDSIYFSNQAVKTQLSPAGEFQGMVGLFDSVYVDGSAQPAQIRIRMNDSWGQKIISADASNYSFNENFVNFLKGLAIVPEQTSSFSSNGAIFYFNPLSAFTGVTIHYHTPNDTSTFQFVTNSQTANFSTFSHDYSMAPVGSALNDTATGSQKLYLQSTVGTDLEIEFKDIVAVFGSEPKVINYAELIIPVDTTQPYFPVDKLSVSQINADGSTEFLPDQVETGNRVIDGSFNADSAYYRFRLTQYIQDIIKNYTPGQDESQVLRISPYGTNTLANRSVLIGPRPANPGDKKMRLRITYTPLN